MPEDRMVTGPAAASNGGPLTNGDDLPFGASLEPVLTEACAGRLHEVHWFRTDWQRGGALTGYAGFRDDHGQTQPVVLKLPVPPHERRWLIHLQQADDVAPRLWAHGETLGGYDMAWVVMERLPHGPISAAWGAVAFDLMIEALVRFSAAVAAVPVAGQPRGKDYEAICKRARDHIQRHDIAHEQRWKKALKAAQKKLKEWLGIWNGRPTDQWCHGDFHFGNGMTRHAPPAGPVILLDYAEVHRGHWLEDAVHFEHFYWSRRDRLEGRKLVSLIAKQRKAHGLAVGEDWAKLAAVARALQAMSTPAMLEHEGNPQHLQAALELLETQGG